MSELTRIVNTDNFGGDYPNETFVNLPALPGEENKIICKWINRGGEYASRYYKVVPTNYVLDDEPLEY